MKDRELNSDRDNSTESEKLEELCKRRVESNIQEFIRKMKQLKR